MATSAIGKTRIVAAINACHPRERGDPSDSALTRWIPAGACPRMLESGAGMTIDSERAESSFD